MKKFLFLILALIAAPALADPVSAGFAIYSIYAGATMATSVIAGMMVIGGVAALAGNIGGDKNLQKYGGLVSAMGGIGNALAGAGEVASVATIAEEGGGAQLGAEGALGAGPGDGSALASPVSPGGDVTTAGLEAPPELAGGEAAPATLETNKGLIDSAYEDPSRALDMTQNAMPGSSEAVTGAPPPSGDAAQATQATQAQNPLRVQEAANGVPGAAPAEKGLADYLRMGSDFMKQNKELVNIGGKMVEGAFTAKNKQEQQQAIWDEEARRRAAYSDSVAKSVVPYGVNAKTNVNAVTPQNPVRYAPPQKPPGA